MNGLLPSNLYKKEGKKTKKQKNKKGKKKNKRYSL
jgi:hypothetical protein